MIKILELFGGIGACSNALKRLNIPFKIVDYVEIDKYAVKSYNAIYGTNFEPQDITTWNKDVEVDLIMHGSPCQDFSLAGKQAGGDKDSGTRSSLMYETLRIVEKLKPKYVIWENVKNILNEKHIHNFNAYLDKLYDLGYQSYWDVINAKDFGIPQNRERVFTISIRNDIENEMLFKGKMFEFPSKQELKLKLKDLLEENVEEKYYLSEKMIDKRDSVNLEHPNSKTRRGRVGNQVAQTLVTSCNQGVIIGSTQKHAAISTNGVVPTLTSAMGQGGGHVPMHNYDLKIRKLTPKECWRLMGFQDEDFEKAEKVNSNTQLYKQAGNSIVVNVLMEILRNLLLHGQAVYEEKKLSIYDMG